MNQTALVDRIVVDPKVMAGKPVIRGTRLTVQYIVGLLASGASVEEVLGEYEGLARDDILACLRYAADMLDNTEVLPLAFDSS
ncbi:MAG TPA: DUF433 domain-containing protein [Chloroflexota bacterium]|nr:DUF433 domain-containing protein [Chloroflexota bacterium]